MSCGHPTAPDPQQQIGLPRLPNFESCGESPLHGITVKVSVASYWTKEEYTHLHKRGEPFLRWLAKRGYLALSSGAHASYVAQPLMLP